MSKETLPLLRKGKIVFKGKTAGGIPYLIRYPKRTDLQELWRYINELSKEKTYISLQGEEMSLKEEREFLNKTLKRIKEKEGVALVVESNGKIIGISDVNRRERAERHTGVFGITLAKEFRGKGIGRKLMELVMEEARQNLRSIKIIRLVCFADNKTACKLYQSLGFKEYGKLPGGILYRGEPTDEILMYCELR
ncbi:MAG TPA: GNAT family N-acetyltransferase [Patescibacteria group bacterium]|nr:GNAT family N-acetyltransferase [Patescibacteria group bacterium]